MIHGCARGARGVTPKRFAYLGSTRNSLAPLGVHPSCQWLFFGHDCGDNRRDQGGPDRPGSRKKATPEVSNDVAESGDCFGSGRSEVDECRVNGTRGLFSCSGDDPRYNVRRRGDDQGDQGCPFDLVHG